MEALTKSRMAWSLEEISNFTGLSVAFLRNEIRGRRLPFKKFGRRVLILDEDLQSYLANGSPGSPTQIRREI
jgi:excisionase family DNA binding protein